jgi:hypothetical protein
VFTYCCSSIAAEQRLPVSDGRDDAVPWLHSVEHRSADQYGTLNTHMARLHYHRLRGKAELCSILQARLRLSRHKFCHTML